MDMNLANIWQRRNAESRSISAENPRGKKGGGAQAEPEGESHASRELGKGWKVRPCIPLEPGETVTLMDNDGPGVIRHIWVTFAPEFYRDVILRIYWDGLEKPSVEAPLGDFMCCGWNKRQKILALPVNVNPNGGMNMFFPMPFGKHAKITVTNDSPNRLRSFFYTINYTLEKVPEDALYFHAQWRRSNPLPNKQEYVILEGVKGRGQYVGSFMCWQHNNNGWWGEGEIKFYMDGDAEYPTICGTGTEDYFGGAWNFGAQDFTAPFFGFQQVEGESEEAGSRMTLYRFHVHDPIFFSRELKVTMQALGWRKEGRFLPLRDDLSSVAYWYQELPPADFPPLPGRNEREII